MSLSTLVIAAAEEHHEVNHALSWGIGATVLAIMLGMLAILLVFAGGREHS